MDRPLKRPETKYTPETFLKAASQHFIEDKSPQCTIDILDATGTEKETVCAYSQTGCWIGFILTAEDAEQANKYGSLNSYNEHLINILSHYFDLFNPIIWFILTVGQYTHDAKEKEKQFPSKEEHLKRMQLLINSLYHSLRATLHHTRTHH